MNMDLIELYTCGSQRATGFFMPDGSAGAACAGSIKWPSHQFKNLKQNKQQTEEHKMKKSFMKKFAAVSMAVMMTVQWPVAAVAITEEMALLNS